MGTQVDQEATNEANEAYIKRLRQKLSAPDWITNLNDYMSCVSEFLIATASQNNFGSVCSQIAMGIANSIPVMTSVEDFASAE